jgi:hypothetical protein
MNVVEVIRYNLSESVIIGRFIGFFHNGYAVIRPGQIYPSGKSKRSESTPVMYGGKFSLLEPNCMFEFCTPYDGYRRLDGVPPVDYAQKIFPVLEWGTCVHGIHVVPRKKCTDSPDEIGVFVLPEGGSVCDEDFRLYAEVGAIMGYLE